MMKQKESDMKDMSTQIMTKLFGADSTTRRVSLNRETDKFVEIISKRNIKVEEGKLGRIIRFEDGTAIKVTYELVK